MIGITTRICRKDYPDNNFEWRDCLAHDWPRFLKRSMPETSWLMLPNLGAEISDYVEKLGVSSLIFSGGEEWGIFPLRDETEQELFHWAADKPMLGICRGAQVINQLLGGNVTSVQAHVACKHKIKLDTRIAGLEECVVNSYHNFGIGAADLAAGLIPFAWSPDGYIEGFISADDSRICGIMWHPEREEAPGELDSFLLHHLTKGNVNG